MKLHLIKRKKRNRQKFIIGGVILVVCIGIGSGTAYVLTSQQDRSLLQQYAIECQQNREKLSALLGSGTASYGSVIDLLGTFSTDEQEYPPELSNMSTISQEMGRALLLQLQTQDTNALITTDDYTNHLTYALQPYKDAFRTHITNFSPDITNVFLTTGCDFRPVLSLIDSIKYSPIL